MIRALIIDDFSLVSSTTLEHHGWLWPRMPVFALCKKTNTKQTQRDANAVSKTCKMGADELARETRKVQMKDGKM